MSSLRKHIEKNIQELPRHFLLQIVKKKLEEQEVENDELAEAIVDHVFSESEQPFEWDDGDDGLTKNLSINFSEQDSEDVMEEMNTFLKEGLPKVIQKTLKDGAKSLVKELETQWPEEKVESQNDNRRFRDRIDLRWAKGLDPLRMLVIASREVGEEFASKLVRSKAKKGLIKREAIMILHMRACQTALEIVTLLENGLPDGAFARWRTLYEISVVTFVIDQFGDDIAERYFAHDAVSVRDSVMNEFRHDGRNYDPTTLKGELKEIEEDFQAAVLEFGKSFKGPYGWAAHSLENNSPRFQDLEEAVDWNALPPDYKWSSYKVHAGIAGAVRSLGTTGGEQVIHAGATNAGLETPAINTAFSLLHVTSLVFSKPNELETQIQMQGLVLLRDKVVKECSKAAKKLEIDELELQNGFDA
jgi:Family of unknown function (DUF5677)